MRASRALVGQNRVSLLLLGLVVLLMIPLAWPATAATEVLYVTATGHYMRGVFRDFWDKNGGLPNFGYPLTEEYIDPASKRVFQYYERARFERATDDSTTVELGNLGREYLGNRAIERRSPIQNTSQRRYFPETGQILQYGFKTIWETRGGLAIFGLPLTSELDEPFPDGKIRTVQYFERCRFEYYPELPDGQRVVITDLGRLFAPRELTAPLAPNNPPPGPIQVAPTATPGTPPSPTRPPTNPTATPSGPRPTPTPTPPPIVPGGLNGRVTPAVALPGQKLSFEASGFDGNEKISLWLTRPDGKVQDFSYQTSSNKQGVIPPTYVDFTLAKDAPLGTWAITGQGLKSQKRAVGYFVVLPATAGQLPQPPGPGPGVPPNVNARVSPASGPAGTIFFFDALRFRPNEEVQMAIIGSDGRRIDFPAPVAADAGGGIGYAKLYYLSAPGDSLGLYSFVAVGTSSGATATAYFVLTP